MVFSLSSHPAYIKFTIKHSTKEIAENVKMLNKAWNKHVAWITKNDKQTQREIGPSSGCDKLTLKYFKTTTFNHFFKENFHSLEMLNCLVMNIKGDNREKGWNGISKLNKNIYPKIEKGSLINPESLKAWATSGWKLLMRLNSYFYLDPTIHPWMIWWWKPSNSANNLLTKFTQARDYLVFCFLLIKGLWIGLNMNPSG